MLKSALGAIGALLLLVAALYYLRHTKPVQPGVTSMRMATVFKKSSSMLDPAAINSIEEYELVQNLYRPLVEYDLSHNLVPGLAKSFYWEGESLVFEFDPSRVVTFDGDSVTAEDAARSLKRAIFYGKTGHGDLRTFLCPNQKLISIDEECPGIRAQQGKLILTPVKSYYKSFLLKILESADYVILPRKALANDPKNPKIISHKNTSGPYYIDSDDAGGAWTLKANKKNYSFHPDLPETITLVPTEFTEAVDRLNAGDFDYVPASAIPGTVSIDSVLEQSSRFNFHESMAFRLRMVCFTPKAMTDFTSEQRFYAASLMKAYIQSRADLKGAKETVEFFQALSEGTLTDEQREEIARARRIDRAVKLPRPITVGGPGPLYTKLKDFFAGNPDIKVIELKDYAFYLPVHERPDMYIIFSDSAWTESLSVLGHNFNVSVFHMPGLNPDKWLSEYVETEEKSERLKKLKRLHFDLLKTAAIYPVSVSPYYTIATKPWILGFSTFSSGTELWQMRKEH